MKRVKLQGLLVLAMVAAFSTGCATQVREMIGAASQVDVNTARADVAHLKTAKAEGSDVKTVADTVGEVAKTVGEVKQKGEANAAAITGLTGRMTGAEGAVATLTTRMDKANEWAKRVVATLDKKADGDLTDQRFKLVDGKIAAAAASARSATARVAERTGEGEDRASAADGTVLKIGPFPKAEYDKAGNRFTVCADLTDAMKSRVEAAQKYIADGGYEVEKVIGGADVRKFVGKDKKPLANSDELNGECATLRAQAVASRLGFDVAKVNSHGPTARYGELYDPNRTVRVYLKKK